MSQRNPPKPLPGAVSDASPDTVLKVNAAAEAQWNRPIPADLTAAIAANQKIAQSCIQLLDQFPVTAAMQFAVAYGWMLGKRGSSSPPPSLTDLLT